MAQPLAGPPRRAAWARFAGLARGAFGVPCEAALAGVWGLSSQERLGAVPRNAIEGLPGAGIENGGPAARRSPRDAVALCFSGGKDSVLALEALHRDDTLTVVELLTTVTTDFDRVSMHGVRRTLARAQADALGIPLTEVPIPANASNAIYEREMGRALARLRAAGTRGVAFGDIFLEDLRAYRERQLAAWSLTAHFPLWRQDTAVTARRFIEEGFQAVLVCVDPRVLDASFAGRPFDAQLIADLPDDVDPCGERGEFHTFVWDGPLFRRPVPVSRGPVVERDGFIFCDLVPQPVTT